MKHALMLAMICTFALSACGDSLPPLQVGKPQKLTNAEITQVKTGIDTVVRGPNVAVIDKMAAAKLPDGTTMVCGYLRLQDGTGTHAGFSAFNGLIIPEAGKFIPAGVGENASTSKAIREVCRGSGVLI